MDELISEQDAIPVVIDRWAIDTVGLEEEILCEMCENPMHTDRGCDGMCSYDKDLYKRIIKVLNDRMKPLQPEKPDITHEQAIDYLHETGWLQNHDRILTESKIVPPVQPNHNAEVSKMVDDLISRRVALDALTKATYPMPIQEDIWKILRELPQVQPTNEMLERCKLEYIHACKIVSIPTPDVTGKDKQDAYAVIKALHPIFGDVPFAKVSRGKA